MTVQQVTHWLSQQRLNKRVVLVTGVFDLLHEEHVNFLHKAQELGDILVIGIESDSRVRQLKGENRPVWNQNKRLVELLKLQLTEAVFVLPEEFSKPQDHELLVAQIKPDFLAVSSHTPHQDKKRQLIEKYGGQLRVVLEHNPEVSTTLKLKS